MLDHTLSLILLSGIDWGSHSGTDCTTPAIGGPGNTHSSRTGFYELNNMMELARSHLPNNPWLQSQLTSNMNIDDTCNAWFDSNTGEIGFYRSGGKNKKRSNNTSLLVAIASAHIHIYFLFKHLDGCANTGEIAHVFDHEWGHGMGRPLFILWDIDF